MDQVDKIKPSLEMFINVLYKYHRRLSRDSDGHEIGLVY